MTPRQVEENRIECQVERKVDRLDYRYMNGEMSDSQYHEEMRTIDAWAEAQYALLAV
jgi:hypothetical protein